jgi:hypothetical protein
MFAGDMTVQIATGLAVKIKDLPSGDDISLPCDVLQDVLDPELDEHTDSERQLSLSLHAHINGGYRYRPVSVLKIEGLVPMVAVHIAAGRPLLVDPHQELLTRWGWRLPSEIHTGIDGVACRSQDGRPLWTRVYEVRAVAPQFGYTLGYADNIVVNGITCRTALS